MSPEQIQITDWLRILFGKTGGVFFVELLIRITVVYAVLLISMRLMGKRLASRLSSSELIAISALAAAIGIPMQNPERGLVPGMIVAAVVVLFQRSLARLATRGGRKESYVEGRVSVLLADSVLRYHEMKKTRITRQRLFAQLRGEGIRNLGEVSRVYLEANGDFTVVRRSPAEPGLSIIPFWDESFRNQQPVQQGVRVCSICGAKFGAGNRKHCENCNSDEWAEPELPQPHATNAN